MKVKELIELLMAHDLESEVLVHCNKIEVVETLWAIDQAGSLNWFSLYPERSEQRLVPGNQVQIVNIEST